MPGRQFDFAKLPTIGRDVEDGDKWLIPLATGLTLNETLAYCRTIFPIESDWGDDLDGSFQDNDRSPLAGQYSVEVFANIEADENFAGMSYDRIIASTISGITLLERLMLGAIIYRVFGQHLDIDTMTLCTGSRAIRGDDTIPAVHFGVDPEFPQMSPCVHIDHFSRGAAFNYLRTREVRVV
ncbi:MAG: hypothetical protein WC517_03905 [Patescibacteria group bacterium]